MTENTEQEQEATAYARKLFSPDPDASRLVNRDRRTLVDITDVYTDNLIEGTTK